MTYTERQGCDDVELRYDHDRGWRATFYDARATRVAFELANALGPVDLRRRAQ